MTLQDEYEQALSNINKYKHKFFDFTFYDVCEKLYSTPESPLAPTITQCITELQRLVNEFNHIKVTDYQELPSMFLEIAGTCLQAYTAYYSALEFDYQQITEE